MLILIQSKLKLECMRVHQIDYQHVLQLLDYAGPSVSIDLILITKLDERHFHFLLLWKCKSRIEKVLTLNPESTVLSTYLS